MSWLFSRALVEEYLAGTCSAGEPSARWNDAPPTARREIQADIQAALRYAIKGATMNGRETDFDPDALVQNMIVGLFGYYQKSEWGK